MEEQKKKMTDFMIVKKGDYKSWDSMSSEQKQRLMEKYYGFVNRLKREDRFKSGSSLKHGGVQLRNEDGLVTVDGPFSETKEALTGYLIIEAKDQSEAVDIARECPALTHGETVQVFEMD